MTNIPISKSQENKLIEMARYYFPEYTDFTIVNINQRNDLFFRKGTQEFLMSWFEFLVVRILHEIVERNPDESFNRGITLLIASLYCKTSIHPIDTTYQVYERTSN